MAKSPQRHKPDYTLEARLGGIVCGVDEVGRGPLAGPVVAAAVILDPAKIPPGLLAMIDDSKRLTPSRRRSVAEQLPEFTQISIAEASVGEIDALNILQASLLAMRRAVESLSTAPTHALIDGNKSPKLGCPALCVIKGDQRSLSIAAASIVAKECRDMKMTALAKEFPGYGWEDNAGYGTAQHLKALQELGITPWHRRSFAPVRACLPATG